MDISNNQKHYEYDKGQLQNKIEPALASLSDAVVAMYPILSIKGQK